MVAIASSTFSFSLPSGRLGGGRSRQVHTVHAQAGGPEEIASRYVLVHTGGRLRLDDLWLYVYWIKFVAMQPYSHIAI
jgi:hypothetical protein